AELRGRPVQDPRFPRRARPGHYQEPPGGGWAFQAGARRAPAVTRGAEKASAPRLVVERSSTPWYHDRKGAAGTFPESNPREDHVMGNPFVHVELMSNDVGKAKSFFGKLFDWTLEDMPMGDSTYTVIKVGEGTGGGIMKNPMPGAPSAWMAYVVVDDLKSTT